MNSYEENKKEGRLNENGSFNESENPSLKETVMNFVGYGVHSIFGSSQAGDVKNDKPLSKSEKAKLEEMAAKNEQGLKYLLLNGYIDKGSISNVLQFDNPIIKICALEVIQEKFNDIKGWPKFKRPETIVNALKALSDTSDTDIKRRAIKVATALKDNDYFNANQKDILKGISEIKIEESKEEEKEDTEDTED